jgi:hypothetical protein
LANSSVTIGSTTVSLGATSTSLAGLTSATFAGSTSGTTQILSGATAGSSVLTLPVATDANFPRILELVPTIKSPAMNEDNPVPPLDNGKELVVYNDKSAFP